MDYRTAPTAAPTKDWVCARCEPVVRCFLQAWECSGDSAAAVVIPRPVSARGPSVSSTTAAEDIELLKRTGRLRTRLLREVLWRHLPPSVQAGLLALLHFFEFICDPPEVGEEAGGESAVEGHRVCGGFRQGGQGGWDMSTRSAHSMLRSVQQTVAPCLPTTTGVPPPVAT
jgi:hypothetical protein